MNGAVVTWFWPVAYSRTVRFLDAHSASDASTGSLARPPAWGGVGRSGGVRSQLRDLLGPSEPDGERAEFSGAGHQRSSQVAAVLVAADGADERVRQEVVVERRPGPSRVLVREQVADTGETASPC